MQDATDMDLLRQYASGNSDTAFTELVLQHLNLVYCAALRKTGNPHAAEEVTQAVFIILAQKAGRISDKTILPGWLYQTTRLTAASFLKSQTRRIRREQEAYMQTELHAATPVETWEHLAPVLEDAMGQLGEKDRAAVVLRFFCGKSFAEVGTAAGVSENAAKKRVGHALEKLRRFFKQRGITLSAAVIASAVAENSVQAAPVGLAKTVAAVAIAKGAAATTSTLTLVKGALKIMAWTKAKSAIVVVAAILLAAGTTTVVVKRVEAKEREIENLWRINKDIGAERIDTLPPLVRVLPTKFVRSPWANWGVGTNGDKFFGANVSAGEIAAYAYGFPRSQIRFADAYPTNKFDFIATLPKGSR
jgi:RNA polymerase sigma factor (sigma-70 family)